MRRTGHDINAKEINMHSCLSEKQRVIDNVVMFSVRPLLSILCNGKWVSVSVGFSLPFYSKVSIGVDVSVNGFLTLYWSFDRVLTCLGSTPPLT